MEMLSLASHPIEMRKLEILEYVKLIYTVWTFSEKYFIKKLILQNYLQE